MILYVFVYKDFSDSTLISYHLADDSITFDEQFSACVNQFSDDIKEFVSFEKVEFSSIALDIKR